MTAPAEEFTLTDHSFGKVIMNKADTRALKQSSVFFEDLLNVTAIQLMSLVLNEYFG